MSTEEIHKLNLAIEQIKFAMENPHSLGASNAIRLIEQVIESAEPQNEVISAESFYFKQMKECKTPVDPASWLKFSDSFANLRVDQEQEKTQDTIILLKAKIEALEKEIESLKNDECKCTVDDQIGTTKLWCCNVCGKRTEKF